jgi:hypothetical protein
MSTVKWVGTWNLVRVSISYEYCFKMTLPDDTLGWSNLSLSWCDIQPRIKKIMQADEDVGKIALAVPVLVCKFSS